MSDVKSPPGYPPPTGSPQPTYNGAGAPYPMSYAHPQGAPYAQQQQGGSYPYPQGSPQAGPHPGQQGYPQQPQQQQQQQQWAPQPPVVVSQPQVLLTQPQVMVVGGGCPQGQHFYTNHFGACGIIAAILLFPIGLIFLFVDQERRCTRCGARG